jgi:Outer membrane lipoprotein-sorting protein
MINKNILIIFFIFLYKEAVADIKKGVIEELRDIENISFNFEQNINGKIENGSCTILYPKKIYCEYNVRNKKVLVSNGNSLVIKTNTSYYIYPLKKTPLNLILYKNYLINKINILKERILEDKFINFTFNENDNEINIFFDKKDYDLVGWQTLDIYQNLSITFISSLTINNELNDNLFILPKQD